jgi:protein O-mannosyl-transferase
VYELSVERGRLHSDAAQGLAADKYGVAATTGIDQEGEQGSRATCCRDVTGRGHHPGCTARASNSGRFDVRRFALGLGVALTTFVAFAPALCNGFVDWDDPDNFLRNEQFRGLDSARLGWMFTTTHAGHYQPLSWVTLGFDYVWGRAVFGDGMDPRSYHLTSSLLHAANAVLVYLLALRLLATAFGASATRPAGRLHAAAALAALLFALHPLRVESVAWITERRDVLSSFFLLLATLLYVRAPTGPSVRRWKWLALVLIVYTLSLLSRALGTVLPAILLLLDGYPLRRFESRLDPGRWTLTRAVVLEKLPFFALALLASVMAVAAQAGAGAAFSAERHGLLARLIQTCYGLAFYVGKTLVPTGLAPMYELRLPLDIFATRYVVAVALALFGLFGLVLLIRARRGRAVVVAAACYALLILPVSGSVQSGRQEVADRYSYLPAAVLVTLLAGGALRAWSTVGKPRAWKAGLVVAGVVTASALAVLTWRQCGIWRSPETLWTHAVRVQPDSSITHNSYGCIALGQKRLDEALAHFRRALEIRPTNGLAHRNAWRVLREQGRREEWLAAVREALRLLPDFADAHYELAWQLADRGEVAAAIREYGRTLVFQPDHSAAHTNLAGLLKRRGQVIKALQHYEAGAMADRCNAYAWRGWAEALHEQDDGVKAIAVLRVALQIDPRNAWARQAWREWTGKPPPA